MKIVVTGSGGQLGSELCGQLGRQAVGLDLPQFDLTNRQAVLDQLASIRPEIVINTAAYTQVDKAEEQPDICRAVNALGVANLIDACRGFGATLAQISTDYVFGEDAGRSTPYRETDRPATLGVYGRTKLEGERIAAQYEKHFIVRTCGLYGRAGPTASGNFVETMLRLAQTRDSLRVVNDQHCTPSFVAHVARAVCFLVGTRAYGTYHIVNTGQTTWFDFAAEIFRQAGIKMRLEPISTAEYAAPAPRAAYTVLDTTKYHSLPGCPPVPTWQQGLADYLTLARSPATGKE